MHRKSICSVVFLCLVCGSQLSSAETLYGIASNRKYLKFSVVSHGCTKPGDFKVLVREKNQLEIVRTRRDRCRKRPELKTISISWQQLEVSEENKNKESKEAIMEGADFSIRNPFAKEKKLFMKGKIQPEMNKRDAD